MRTEMYAVEYVNNVPTRVHVFLPEKDPQQSDYRALVSMGAFDKRMCQICGKNLMARRFWLKRKHEWDQLVDSDKRMMRLRHSPIYVNLPKRMHDDLWSFYRAVGWDYKSKRFI
ncbi:hypothetical protein pEaSNUABM52_00074 [Erwinia phage pEp_SNUABM_52]|nr:hypothetical protein pEaSNUABM52_00074 [Erwinia phage pEp_SNUABM_52]